MERLTMEQKVLWRIRDHFEREGRDACFLCIMPERTYRGFCDRCRGSVDAQAGEYGCPCLILGKEEARKRAWIAIDEQLGNLVP